MIDRNFGQEIEAYLHQGQPARVEQQSFVMQYCQEFLVRRRDRVTTLADEADE